METTYRMLTNLAGSPNYAILVRSRYEDMELRNWLKSRNFVYSGGGEWKVITTPANAAAWCAALEKAGMHSTSGVPATVRAAVDALLGKVKVVAPVAPAPVAEVAPVVVPVAPKVVVAPVAESREVEQAALDDIFATDSSDNDRMPAPMTADDAAMVAAMVAADCAFLQDRVAYQQAWARQETWENQ